MIARTLGPERMGVYGYATWLVAALGVLANLGLPAAVTKYVSEYLGRGEAGTAAHVGRKLMRAQLIFAGCVAGVTACLALVNAPYRGIIVVVALMLFAQALQQSLAAVLAGIQRFDTLALIGVYVALAQVASVGVAAFFHVGVVGMLWATLGGLAVAIWLYYQAVHKLLLKLLPNPSYALPAQTDIFRRVTRFSLTISYILLLDTIVWQRSEVLFLNWYSTLTQIAFYTIAYSIAAKLNDVGSSFSSILLPLYSESYGRNGVRGMASVYVNAMKYTQIVMVPFCLLGVAVAKPAVNLIYGTSYVPLVLPLQLLLVTLAFTCVGVVGSPLLVATEKQGFLARYGTAIAILNVALDLILIPKHGALGAAGANCTAQIAGVLGGTFYVLRHVQIRFPWRTAVTIYSAAALALAPMAYFGSRPAPGIAALVLSSAVGAVLYLGLLAVRGEWGGVTLIS